MKNGAVTELTSHPNSDLPPLSHPETPAAPACGHEANRIGSKEQESLDTSPKFEYRDQSDGNSVPTAPKRICLRVTVACIALIPLTLLIIAGNLDPAEKGLGTHQQLGLPPCSLRLLAGIRCPACGMTTSWSYFARGNWLASINTNAGGFLLALLCILMTVLAAQVVRFGRLPSPRVQAWLTMSGAGVLAVTLVDWIIRLQF